MFSFDSDSVLNPRYAVIWRRTGRQCPGLVWLSDFDFKLFFSKLPWTQWHCSPRTKVAKSWTGGRALKLMILSRSRHCSVWHWQMIKTWKLVNHQKKDFLIRFIYECYRFMARMVDYLDDITNNACTIGWVSQLFFLWRLFGFIQF